MIIRPLIQLRQTVETTLRGMTNISKSFVTFFIETMEMQQTDKLHSDGTLRQVMREPFPPERFHYARRTEGACSLCRGGKGSDVVQRFISMSGGRPYLHFNHNDFKELLFYGVRDAA